MIPKVRGNSESWKTAFFRVKWCNFVEFQGLVKQCADYVLSCLSIRTHFLHSGFSLSFCDLKIEPGIIQECMYCTWSNLLRDGIIFSLFQAPCCWELWHLVCVAPMVHGGPQEGGWQVVKADQQTLDPCEEENDDLPLAIVAHFCQNVFKPRPCPRRPTQ